MDFPQVVKKYKHAVIATDVVIFTVQNGQLKVLLIKMKKHPYANMWAAPGGLVRPDESLEDAATRILYAETSVKNVYLEQLYTFGQVDRDPFGRVVSVAYFALIPSGGLQLKTIKEYGGVGWFPVKDLPELAYDHRQIIDTAIERLAAKLSYTNVIYGLLPDEFTLADVQKFYEVILGHQLDKRNFRKKILSLGIVEKINKKKNTGPNRPAELYKFKERKPQMIELL
jgi:8-oxo-dGTP diphosphatase